MHILIIPSEEYIPFSKPIAGIFQHDQAKIIQQKGNQVGALSFTFNFSLASLLKALIGKRNKQTKNLSSFSILRLMFKKTFSPFKSSLSYETTDFINVVRCDGYWGVKTSGNDLSRLELWCKYGEFAIEQYIIKFGKPDVIHAHNMLYAGLFTHEIQKKINIPVVITEHSSQYAMEEISLNIESKLKEVFNQHSFIFAVSPKLIELLSTKFNSGANKIKWLPNVLDPFIEGEELDLSNRNRQKVRFLNIGNLIKLKGQRELIEAFYQAFENAEDVELVIAGAGELKLGLNQKIKDLGIENKVKMIGLIDRKEVVNQMDQSDVFVLPSHYETFGVVLIEALSRGLPVISTYCGGPECIVNEKNGLLVQPKKINELADALLKMYHEHTTYNRLDLRKKCLELYGKEAFYDEVMAIYLSAIQPKSI